MDPALCLIAARDLKCIPLSTLPYRGIIGEEFKGPLNRVPPNLPASVESDRQKALNEMHLPVGCCTLNAFMPHKKIECFGDCCGHISEDLAWWPKKKKQ